MTHDGTPELSAVTKVLRDLLTMLIIVGTPIYGLAALHGLPMS